MALRQQLAVLQRQVKRPRFTWPDSALVALFSGLVSRERWQGLLVTPQTLLDRHRRLQADDNVASHDTRRVLGPHTVTGGGITPEQPHPNPLLARVPLPI